MRSLLRLHGDKGRISQATAKRAADRVARKDPTDADLTVDEIQQDEATRAPLNARARRRALQAAWMRGERRVLRKQQAKVIAHRLATPAPSRREQRRQEAA